MNGEPEKAPRTSGGAAFSTLWVAKLIPLFDGFDLASLGRWTSALEHLACQGRVGDRADLVMLFSERVLPELAREELPKAVQAWEAAAGAPVDGAETPASPPRRVRRGKPAGTGVLRAAKEARSLEAPREAFLAAFLYDRVARLVSRASGVMRLSEKACREVIRTSFERAPKLVEAALRLQSDQVNA